jgi:hypothetical protein
LDKVILHIILLLCGLLPLSAEGQDSLAVTNDMQFSDGLYLSAFSFRSNEPDVRWESVGGDLFINPNTDIARFRLLGVRDSIPEGLQRVEDIWGFTYQGAPYIRIPREKPDDLPRFALLRVRGKICYYTYEVEEKKEVVIKAYNPLTGQPFRQGTVETEERVRIKKILHFERGENSDFTLPVFREWIQDDKRLVKTIDDLSPEEAEEKLFKCLLIYNDRNLVYVPDREVEKD